MANKVSQVEKEKRIYEISLLLRRKPTSYIVQFITQNWNMERRQAYNYIKDARKEWLRYFTNLKHAGISYYISELKEVKDKGYQAEDWRLVLDIIKEEMKIMGIYPSERHKVEVTGKIEMSQEEMYELIQLAQRAVNSGSLFEGDQG